MDFARDRIEGLDPALMPPLYIAHQPGAGEPSGVVHSDLRERYARDPRVRLTMERIALTAREGSDAIARGHHARLARLVDQTFDLRRELMPVDDAAVERARSAGASANYAGSGGAIAGTLPAPEAIDDVAEALAPLGWQVRAVRPTAGTSARAPARSAARPPAGT